MLSCAILQSNGTGKQDVVFQVDVLVQILLELFEARIKCAECWACTLRRPVVLAQVADLGHKIPSNFVIFGHHRNRMGYRSEAIPWLSPIPGRVSLQLANI